MRIRIRDKQTGRTGSIDESEFDPAVFDRIDQPAQTTQPTQVPEERKSVLQQVADFMIPKIKENVIDPVARTGGMALDYGRYAMAKTPEERKRIGEEYGKKFVEQEKWAEKKGFPTQLGTGQPDVPRLLKENLQTGLEGASFAVPAGKGLKGATAMGAASGLMRGISEAETPMEVLTKGGAGAVGGALFGAGTNLAGKALSGVARQISNKATQGISKATPTQWSKAVAEHGYDLNNLIKEFVPPGLGYDELLGEVGKRGKGGVLGLKMGQAENLIQRSIDRAGSTIKVSADDVVKALNKELRDLAKIPGNENNIAALTAFIDQTKKLYKNGITQKNLLNIKRAAESKFGKAIVDESTGSVEAQGQKILANWSRNILKKLNPTIAKQLDTQSKIYTLQPILEKARGTLNTQGSQIRQGAFNSLTDLINPFAYADAAMNNPKIASRLVNLGANKTPPDLLVKGAQTLGAIGGIGAQKMFTPKTLPPIDQVTAPETSQAPSIDTTQTEIEPMFELTNSQTGEKKTVKRSELAQYGLDENGQPIQEQPQGMPTLEELGQAYMNAMQAGDTKAADKLAKMYDMQAKMGKQTLEENKVKQQTNEVSEAVNLVDTILARPLDPVTGTLRVESGIEGTQAYDTRKMVEQLKNKLSLTERQKLKGQGQISNYEAQMLANSVTALDPGMSKEGFIAELQKIKDILSHKLQVPTVDNTGYLPDISTITQ